jgi:hypothetical protein
MPRQAGSMKYPHKNPRWIRRPFGDYHQCAVREHLSHNVAQQAPLGTLLWVLFG